MYELLKRSEYLASAAKSATAIRPLNTTKVMNCQVTGFGIEENEVVVTYPKKIKPQTSDAAPTVPQTFDLS
jgi:hypothetical protein